MIWVLAVEQDGLEEVRKVPGYHDEPEVGARARLPGIRIRSSRPHPRRLRRHGEANGPPCPGGSHPDHGRRLSRLDGAAQMRPREPAQEPDDERIAAARTVGTPQAEHLLRPVELDEAAMPVTQGARVAKRRRSRLPLYAAGRPCCRVTSEAVRRSDYRRPPVGSRQVKPACSKCSSELRAAVIRRSFMRIMEWQSTKLKPLSGRAR